MIKFLTLLLDVINELLRNRNEHRWKQQERQETVKEMNDAINEKIEQAAAPASPDDLERVRSRFDRSRSD